LRNRLVLVAVLVPGAAGLLAFTAGPAQAFVGKSIAGNHCEPLRRR